MTRFNWKSLVLIASLGPAAIGACDDCPVPLDHGSPVGIWQGADAVITNAPGDNGCFRTGTVRPWSFTIAQDSGDGFAVTGSYPDDSSSPPALLTATASCYLGVCTLAGAFTWATADTDAVQTFELIADEAGIVSGAGTFTSVTFYTDGATYRCSQDFTSEGTKS